MQILMIAKTNLNVKDATTKWSFAGIYKKRKKVAQILDKKAKALGIDDQWTRTTIRDDDTAEAGGWKYSYKIINATEDVEVDTLLEE